MQASPGFICDRRTRCKHCLGKPEYITNLAGLSYHSPEWHAVACHGSARAISDKTYYRFRDDREYDYGKLMRENSVRGVASFSSFIVKKQKDQWGNYRQVISCKCGLSAWMYPGPTADQNFLNRKKHITISHYKPRRIIEGLNTTGYTW